MLAASEVALQGPPLLGLGERGRYIPAATFGNVHGVYKGSQRINP